MGTNNFQFRLNQILPAQVGLRTGEDGLSKSFNQVLIRY